MIAVSPESMVLLPAVVVAVSTALAMAQARQQQRQLLQAAEADEELMLGNNEDDTITCSEQHDTTTGCCCVVKAAMMDGLRSSSSSEQYSCYLFEDWMSSTGIFFCVLMLYILLVTIINSIACYKFITTWYQITGSLREQQQHCKYYYATTYRRRTCQEALTVSRYHRDDKRAAAPGYSCCPICLIDLQDREFVASCDEGCHAVFHKDCLFEWLEFKSDNDDYNSNNSGENHTSCPCCRKELLGVTTTPATTTSGWLSDLSTFLGYYPR